LAEPWKYSIVQIGGSSAAVFLGAACALTVGGLDMTLSGLAVGTLAFSRASLSLREKKVAEGKENRTAPIVREALSYGLPAAASAGLTFLVLNFQRFMSEAMWGIAFTGLFSLSLSLGVRAMSVVVMVVTAGAFPIAVRKANAEGLSAGMAQLSKGSVLLLFVLVPTVCILGTFGPAALAYLLPIQYHAVLDEVFPLALLLAAVKFARSHSVDQAFLLARQTTLLAVAGTIEAVTAILLAFGFVSFGYKALLFGPLFACIAVLACMMAIARARYRYSPNVLQFAWFASVAWASVVMASAVISPTNLQSSMAQILTASLGYALLAVWSVAEARSIARRLGVWFLGLKKWF
jgi:O-antigen/teichoic acid export membrane protein